MTRWIRGIVGVLLAVVVLLSAGCGGSATQALTKVKTWAMSPEGYNYLGAIPEDLFGSSSAFYWPDSGYQWLVIKLSVNNKLKEDASWDYLDGTFKLISTNGDKYNAELVLNSPPNALPTYYHPGQTQDGDIFFEVPSSWSEKDATSSTVAFSYTPMDADDQTITIKLTALPKMSFL